MEKRSIPARREEGRDVSRKAYETPAFAWEQATEVRQNLAAACDKIGGSGDPCDSIPAS